MPDRNSIWRALTANFLEVMVLPQMRYQGIVGIAARLPHPFRPLRRHPKIISDQCSDIPRGGCVEVNCAFIGSYQVIARSTGHAHFRSTTVRAPGRVKSPILCRCRAAHANTPSWHRLHLCTELCGAKGILRTSNSEVAPRRLLLHFNHGRIGGGKIQIAYALPTPSVFQLCEQDEAVRTAKLWRDY
jgi:hypothetical protein